MIITMYSNYLTHHQIPFCTAMVGKCEKFYFVSTIPMEDERKTQGWNLDGKYQFEIKAYESKEQMQKAEELAIESDVIIVGSAPEKYIEIRMRNAKSKLVFRYSERIYKKGRWRVISPRGVLIRWNTYFRYINKPLYMICASAYTAGDLALLGSYLGRCFKWGYFPEDKKYSDINNLIELKHPASILWVARLIELKHPEAVVEVADRLKKDGYEFTLDIIGTGEKEEQIKESIIQKGLQGCIHMLGTMPPENVRTHMEKSEIFLFTSDRNEGWGAVLNEAMNSGCAVIANDEIGSVPFLLKDGINGLVYHKGNINELYEKTKNLLQQRETRKQYGISAYRTITEEWCAEVAAQRFVNTCEKLLQGKKEFYECGPCSKAKIM